MWPFMRFLLFIAIATVIGATPATLPHRTTEASHDHGPSAISIDMDPTGNAATLLGARQTCARIQVNGLQDADEDVVDGVTVDITVTEIPATDPILGYDYWLQYGESNLTVLSVQGGFLLASLAGSQAFDVSDSTPDTVDDGHWTGREADLSRPPAASESGSGVLQRLTIGADAGAATDAYDLTNLASETGFYNYLNDANLPDVLENARLAVNIGCPPTDTDGDKVFDVDEMQCGSDPFSVASRPERIDGAFAGVSDDGDAEIDEALPADIPMADCDGDGFPGPAEDNVYSPTGQPVAPTQGDQDPCGKAPDSPPFHTPIGWPGDFVAGGVPDSTNRITLTDMTSFLGPVQRLDTSPGDANYDRRWDIVPGNSGQAKDINSVDMNFLSNFYPAMFSGARAFNGPVCPWP